MDVKTLEYCTNDVKYLPALKQVYMNRINKTWLGKAMMEGEKRLDENKSPKYNPDGKHEVLGPW